MANKNTIEVRLTVNDDGSVTIDQFGKKTAETMQKAEKAVDQSSTKMSSSIGRMKSALLGYAAAAASLYTVIQVYDKGVEAASRLEEATNKFNVVFRDQITVAKTWVAELQESYAMSEREAKTYLSAMQDLLVPMGMNREAAAKLSYEIAKLSADMGSFNDAPTAQVMGDIQSALVGNYETMKKYGVVLNATNVEQEALRLGLAQTKDALTAADRAAAAYSLILKGSEAGIGDMERSTGSYANAQKELAAKTEDLYGAIGKLLLPVITPYVDKLAKWFGANKDLISQNLTVFVKGLSIALETAAAAVQILYNIIKSIHDFGVGAFNAIKAAVESLGEALNKITVPFKLLHEKVQSFGFLKPAVDDVSSSLIGAGDAGGDVADVIFGVETAIKATGDQSEATKKTIVKHDQELVESAKKKAQEIINLQKQISQASVPQTKSIRETYIEQIELEASLVGHVQESRDEITGYVTNAANAGYKSIREAIVAEKELVSSLADHQETTAEKTVAETKTQLNGLETYWQHTFENMHDATASFWYDFLSEGKLSFDRIRQWFYELLANMMAQATTQPIVIPIVTSIASGLGMSTPASAAGTAASAGSSIFDLSKVSGLLSGAGGWGVGGFVGTGASLGSGASISAVSNWTQTGTQFSLGAINWANVAGYMGLAYEAYNLFKSISDQKYLSASGIAIGAGIGAVVGGGPVGAAIGAGIGDIVGGILESVFGIGEDVPEFTLSEHNVRYGKEQSRWTPGKGIGTGYWPEFESDWDIEPTVEYTAIAKAYARGRKEIAENFNESMQTFMDSLPENYLSVVEEALAGMDFTWNAPDYRYEFTSAQEVIENLLLNYADFLAGKFDDIVQVVGKAYYEQDISTSELFGKLSTAKQANVTDLLTGGDLTGEEFQTFLSDWNTLLAVMGEFKEYVNPSAESLSTLAQTSQAAEEKFDAYVDTLVAAGVDITKIQDLIDQKDTVVQREIEKMQAPVRESWGAFAMQYSGQSDYQMNKLQTEAAFADWQATLKDTGLWAEYESEWMATRTTALKQLADAEEAANAAEEEAIATEERRAAALRASRQAVIDEMNIVAAGGTSDQARMQQIAARYGWGNYGTQYMTAAGNYNYANIWGSISEMSLTPERVQAIADFLGLDYETVAGDMQYLASAFGNMKAEAESLGTSLEQEYNQITMSSADYGRWQAASNFETTVEKLDLWLDQGIISEQEFQRMLGMATTIYDHQMAAANALEDAAEEQKAATAALKSACESFDEIEKSWEAKLEGSAYKQQVMGVEDELEGYRERIRNVADAYYEETGKALKIDWNYVESNLSAIRAKEIKDIQKSFYDPFRANLEDVLDSHELTEMEQALKKANAWYSEQAEILEELQEFLSAAEYQQQLDDLNQAWAYILEDMVEETENAWEGVAESISDTLRSLETSTANPADAVERLAIAAQAIKDYTGGLDIASYLDTLGSDAERRSAIEKLMTLYGDYLSAGQAAHDRPSDERTAIYNEVKTAYQTMEALAQGYADEYEVQVAQLDALHQIVINTTALGSYAGGTESIPRTGLYWEHKGETRIRPEGKSSNQEGGNVYFGDINLYGITDGDDFIRKFRAYIRTASGQQEIYDAARFRVS